MAPDGGSPPAVRRVAASAVDYGLVALWAAALAGAVAATGVHRSVPSPSPATGHLLGLATLTVPVTLALAASEVRGGSPGKRLLGLRLESATGGRPAFGRALVRTLLKVALPWELAHAGVWQAQGGGDAVAAGSFAAAYLVVGLAAVGMFRGEPWYDRVCGTRVRETGRHSMAVAARPPHLG